MFGGGRDAQATRSESGVWVEEPWWDGCMGRKRPISINTTRPGMGHGIKQWMWTRAVFFRVRQIFSFTGPWGT